MTITKMYVVGSATLCIDDDDENPITHIVSTRNTLKMYEVTHMFLMYLIATFTIRL